MKRFLALILSVLSLLTFSSVAGCEKEKPQMEKKNLPFYQENPSYDFSVDKARTKNVSTGKYEWNSELDKMCQPFWMGNVIYNETVMLLDNGEEISGKLLYEPTKILSVRDYSWQKEFVENKDYTISGNKIIRTENSVIPYLTEENLHGENLPDEYRLVQSISNSKTDVVRMGATIYTESSLIYGHQLSVSYVYDVNKEDTSYFNNLSKDEFPLTRAKLEKGEDVNIVVLGDSIAEGCSSSSKFKREPFLPDFVDLTAHYLNSMYKLKGNSGTVTINNFAKGGTTSEWGADSKQVDKVIASKPDLFLLHFGGNDNGKGFSQGAYHDNMESIVLRVVEANPQCEVMLFKSFSKEPMSYDEDLFIKYWSQLDRIAELENVFVLDLYTQSKIMLNTKKYMDVTGNGINHSNDYVARLHTMNILSKLVDFSK